MLSPPSSPSRRLTSPPKKKEGRQVGGISSLFKRRKKAFSRSNRKRGSNYDIARLPNEADDDASSCLSVEKTLTEVDTGTGGVGTRLDHDTNNNTRLEEMDDLAQIVQIVEKTVRQVVLYCIVFIAGAKSSPDLLPKVGKVLELSAVAWTTCFVIILLGWLQTHRYKAKMHRSNNRNVLGISSDDISEAQTAIISTVDVSGRENEEIVLPNHQSQQQQQQHDYADYLEHLYIMLGPQQRVIPNCTAVDIDTELFLGKMLLMFRTPEADEISSENPIASYFKGKQRRFEFQWQFKLKKVPEGDMFFCAELDEPVQMGMIQRALTSTALKFVKKMNQGFSYYLSESLDSPSYLSFPIGTSMDRFAVTKPGEPVPNLGEEVIEDVDTMRQRKKGKKIEWNVNDVYTMAVWSAYLDWIDWKLMNFPGIRPFAVTSVAGVQPIKLTLFTTPAVREGEDSVSRKGADRNIVFNMEMSNAVKSTLGKDAKKWLETQSESEQAAKIQLLELLDVDEKSVQTANIDMLDTFDVDEGSLDSVSDGDTSDEEDESDSEEIDEALDADVDNATSYLCCGTPVSLRESVGSYLSSGGGYAVLQSSSTNSIILETIHSARKSSNSDSPQQMIIRSGDVVRVKLVDAATNQIRYLTLHRGWWLRWSSSRPKKNGSFCIRTNDARNGIPISLGAPFSLESRKWSRYQVGAMQSSSARYGGRMLGLCKASGPSPDSIDAELEHDLDIAQTDEIGNKGDKGMIMPLLLCADIYNTSIELSPERVKRSMSLTRQDTNEEDVLYQDDAGNESDHKRYELDVPVYIEMMNRTKRTKQRVYAIRAKECNTETNEDGMTKGKVVMKLRTGHSLASVLRIGLKDLGNKSDPAVFGSSAHPVGLDDDSDTSSSDESDSDDESESSNFLIAGPNHSQCELDTAFVSESDNATYAKVFSDEQQGGMTPGVDVARNDPSPDSLASYEVLSSTVDNQPESLPTLDTSGYQADAFSSFEAAPDLSNSNSKRRRGNKHAAVLGKVAKTLKSSTVVTGKHVIKHSKSIGKGTVNAGIKAGSKISVSVHSKPSSRHEPKSRVSRKKFNDYRDYSMKALAKETKHFDGPSSSGQLLSPDQMRRKVSHILAEISSLASPSESATEAISSLVIDNSQSDLAFLRGGSAELGVILETIDSDFDCECVVARSIWEGRWREELCALNSKENHVSFYAPLTKKPSLVVSFDEIISVRRCDPDTELNPLPGLHLLVIDTAWRCHYLAFLDATTLENFRAKLGESLFLSQSESQQNKAREWETFQLSLESALTGTAGQKWASVSTGRKSKQKKQRRVFNGRRQSFDLNPVTDSGGGNITSDISLYVENLLKLALSFSPDTLDATEASFIEFLDEASRLRSLPLHKVDFSSREAFCIFVNLYHCLLQHSLLIAVDGLPDKVSIYSVSQVEK